MGRLFISGEKSNEICHIRLTPHSPLATEAEVTVLVDAQPQKVKTDALGKILFFDSSSNPSEKQVDMNQRPLKTDELANHSIPPVILSKIESVVCVKAQIKDNEIQFSGFIVDNNGTILSTAHDLTDFEAIRVILFDGQELPAKVLKIDTRRDLLLMQVDLKPEAYIPLAEGRQSIGIGEQIYSAGCPLNLRGTIYSGLINGPPRKLQGLPLWQVNMEIHHGSSGGPVFNKKGQLLAIVKGRYRGTSTIGFLIPMETIIDFLKE